MINMKVYTFDNNLIRLWFGNDYNWLDLRYTEDSIVSEDRFKSQEYLEDLCAKIINDTPELDKNKKLYITYSIENL